MQKRFSIPVVLLIISFMLPASASDIPIFSPGTFFSVVGTTAAPTSPTPLTIGFDLPVLADSSILIFSSDVSVLRPTFADTTVLAGHSSAVVLFDAFNIGSATLTAVYGSNSAEALVSVIPSVPAPAAVWMFGAGLAMLGAIRRRRS